MFREINSKPNFPKIEEEILKFWEKEKIFEKSLEQTKPKSVKPEDEKQKLFTFYDGPPFATGLPHYGHILASTIKDVIPRYQTMKGRFVRRRWGWDCHGLPIEEIVERQLKISGKKEIEKIGIKKFNEACRQQVLTYVSEWGKIVRRMARWVDFENSYKTMDREYMESVWWAFKEIYDKGLIYEGRKVLLYCPRCETPVSNFEVAMDNSYQTITEESVVVKFKVQSSKFKVKEGDTYLLAWTTTPWTLPGNVALAVGKKIDYALVEKNGENLIFADTPLTSALIGGERGGSKLKGNDLIGLEYEPLFEIPELRNNKAYKVYDADFVTTQEGTGIVHTAVVYGEEDYELGQRVGLPVVPLLDEKGHFNDKSPNLIKGKYFKDAEKIIKENLETRGLLFKREPHTHSYPHCWRCGTALFYNAIPAWFVKISNIKNQILKSNDNEINWYPEYLKHGRYEKSVESAPDWNISRNRFWGNPIPVWKCGKCGKDTVVGSIEELKEKRNLDSSAFLRQADGNDNWEGLDLHRPYIDDVILKCEHCGGEARRITEIFDSWFEAASMPFASVHYPFTASREGGSGGGVENEKFIFPAQFVAEYIAQTRAWFYVMHVQSLILFGHAPFQNVVTTGTILAEDGSKMSKSKNNYPDPWSVIEKYGSDSLRFYLMNSVVMQAENLNFSEKDLANVHRKVILILWNVYNYFVTYANNAPQPPLKVRGGEGEILDQWIIARTQMLVNEATKNLDNYDTVRTTREIENYISDLSTWYLRRSRGREDRVFFVTLGNSLLTLSKVMAPFTPYISEHIYRNLTNNPKITNQHPNDKYVRKFGFQFVDSDYESVHLASWPKSTKLTADQEKLLVDVGEIRKIAEAVHAMRAKAGIKLRQPLGKLKVTSGKLKVKELLNILKDEVNVIDIEFGEKLELDMNITSELKIAGLARDLERQVQQFRKESGFKVGEIADLYYETESDMLKKAIEFVDKKKTYLQNVESRISNPGGKDIELAGEILKLNIKKSK